MFVHNSAKRTVERGMSIYRLSSDLIGAARRTVLCCARLLHAAYKICISPLLGDVCRFTPSCADYALEALERHGLIKGTFLSIRRILRCHPFAKGGLDSVPPKLPARVEIERKLI